MGTERADVVVIGAGLAGSAAAWALASRGRSVTVVEAFEPGHRRGSSHGSARIFRRAYPDPLYVRLTGQAQQGWRRLAEEAGEEFIVTTVPSTSARPACRRRCTTSSPPWKCPRS
jgi:glycine/D-amino acid oxidase-like deaminating enzyme